MLFNRKNLPPGFYVYLYLREDGTPYYVGKGKGVRAWKKNPQEFYPPADNSRIVIVAYGLLEIGAFILERKFIRWYGRIDNNTGILHNKTDGGEGGSGRIVSESTRDLFRGDKNPARRPDVKKTMIKNHPANNADTRDAFLAAISNNHATKKEGWVSSLLGENHPRYDATEYCFKNERTGETIKTTQRKFIVLKDLQSANSRISALTKGKARTVSGWIIIPDLQ